MADAALHIHLYKTMYDDVRLANLQSAVVTAAAFILAVVPQSDAIGLYSGGLEGVVWLALLALAAGFFACGFCWFNASLEKHQFLRQLVDILDRGDTPSSTVIRDLYEQGRGNVRGKVGRAIGRFGIAVGMLGLVTWALGAGIHIFLGAPTA